MNQQRLIHIIADYGTGDPAFTEVTQKLLSLSDSFRIIPTSVPAFSTLATGFWTHQLALVNPVGEMIIYTNTAPRKDKKEVREKNEGERLVYAVLNNGVRIIGVNAGYCFSFVKPFIQSLHAVNVANKGSQFRSRDFYPEAVAGISENNPSYIGKTMDTSEIPDVPGNKIAWIDGYGNLKTTMKKSMVNLKSGEPVFITIDNMKRTAYFTDGTFSVREGELAFAPGSSGGTDPFMEIFLRGLSAWIEFGKPHVETDFLLTQ